MKKLIYLLSVFTISSSLPSAFAGNIAENLTLNGDFRYRHETIDKEGSEQRSRQRIRARIGLEADLDDVKIGLQFSTGSDSPVSGNVTLDNGFSTKDLRLDLGYFQWQNKELPIKLTAGKMKNPFVQLKASEIIWDGDLRPEGLAVNFNNKAENLEFNANFGSFWVEENSSSDDVILYGLQSSLKTNFKMFDDKSSILIGAGYYTYDGLKGTKTIYDATNSFGNSIDENGRYLFDYEILDLVAEWKFKLDILPVSIFANYATNNAADVVDGDAYLVGFAVGKRSKPKTMDFSMTYREVEKDAALGAFADSNVFGGGTDGSGLEMSFDYQLTPSWNTKITYFDNEDGLVGDVKDYQRVQIDLKFKF